LQETSVADARIARSCSVLVYDEAQITRILNDFSDFITNYGNIP